MKKEREKRKGWFLLGLILSLTLTSLAQTSVKGTITDATTKAPVAYASVYFKGGYGVTAGSDGSYTIKTNNAKLKTVEISFVGYKTIIQTVVPGKEQVLDVELEQQSALQDVVITNKKQKYKNKDNPAVELIRKVIDNKDKNRVSSYDYVQYQQYEKMQMALTNKPEKLMKNKLLKNFSFVLDNQDTTKLQGKALVPVYLEEKLSDKYFKKDPNKEKTYVLGEKKVNLGDFIDNVGLSSYLNRMYTDVDVYENNISILSNQFLSPIAGMAPTFYRFYIKDTVEVDGIQLAKLYFTPRNTNDLLFRGIMYITLDGNYAIQKINMSISKNVNLNWVRELHVDQDFEKSSDGRYHISKSDMMAEFALTKGSAGGIMGERTVSFKNYLIDTPAADSIYKGDVIVTAANVGGEPDSFWTANRHQPLSAVESKVYANIDSLQNMKSYKRFMDIATLVLAGYKQAGPYEFGPVSTFYSFNPVEGFRLRVGGRTTPKFNKSIFLENYVAYGFKDEKWKYFLSGAYSFNHKSIYSYPLNYVKASFQRDTKIPGQELQFVAEDNFLLSFKRGNNDKWLYNDIWKVEYVKEFKNNVSYTLGFKNWKQTPAGSIKFNKGEGNVEESIPNITTTELSGQVRWAPHEQFYQGKVYRIPIINKYPIFTLKYTAGIKGFLGGEYNYQSLNLNVAKRFYFSQFGFSDVSVEGGYTHGKVPYPLLTIHRANQTYAYQLNSYNLMNFMEFVSDRYAAVNVDYYLNGFLFNKIPLLKKLKWREVLEAKILYGGVRDENNPTKPAATEAFKFPADKDGVQTTYGLNGKPYIEVGAGIANIFKLIRLDFIKRLTYLDNPGISTWGIRFRTKFDF